MLISESVLLTLFLFCLFVARWKKILVIVGPCILGSIVLAVLGVIGFQYFHTERRKRYEIKPSEIVLREGEWRKKQQRQKYDKFSAHADLVHGGSHPKSLSAGCGVMV